jgi:hypothetical protein
MSSRSVSGSLHDSFNSYQQPSGGSSQPYGVSGQSQMYPQSGEGSGYGSTSDSYATQNMQRTAAAAAAAGSSFGHSPMPAAYPVLGGENFAPSYNASGKHFSGPSASVHLDVNGIKGVPTNSELSMSTGSSKADAKPTAKDPKAEGDKKAEGEEGTTDSTTEASAAWYSKIKDKVWDIGSKISEFAHKHLSADNASLLLTILKIKPLVIALLLFPPGIAVTAFTIGIAITVIRPSIAQKNATIFAMSARTVGLYAMFQSIKEAVFMGLSATPQLHLVAVAVYLFVSARCFVFAENISPIFKKTEGDVKKEADVKKKDDEETEIGHSEAVSGFRQWGLASKAPEQSPERDDQTTSGGSGGSDSASGSARAAASSSLRSKGASSAPAFVPQRETSSPVDDFEHVPGSGAASPPLSAPVASGAYAQPLSATSLRPAPFVPGYPPSSVSGFGSGNNSAYGSNQH